MELIIGRMSARGCQACSNIATLSKTFCLQCIESSVILDRGMIIEDIFSVFCQISALHFIEVICIQLLNI